MRGRVQLSYCSLQCGLTSLVTAWSAKSDDVSPRFVLIQILPVRTVSPCFCVNVLIHFRRVRENPNSVSLASSRLPVRMEQLGSHWADFHEFWYLSFFFFSEYLARKLKSFITIRQEWLVFYMKTYRHLWQYLAELSVEWEMFQTKVVEKIKTHLTFNNFFFFRKSCRLWDNLEKCGWDGQATGDSIIRRMRFAYWITKAADTHSEYVILILHGNNGYVNAP